MAVQKRTWKRADGSKATGYRVRWEHGGSWYSKTFDRKSDALDFDADLRRKRQRGELARLDAGRETLDEYVRDTWKPTHEEELAPKTRSLYGMLYRVHIGPTLGRVPLRELTPEKIRRWQSDRIKAGAGRESVRKALTLLGGILQCAAEDGRITSNPARLVRKVKRPRSSEVRPLAPETIEKMRAASDQRDAALISVLAYAGLRPGEALALRWGDVRDRTLLIERATSAGEEKDTKTGSHRTVRLLAPLARDLAEWRLRCGRPGDNELIFPGHDGAPWTEAAYQSWRRRAFARALKAARVDHARPYDLRHSFASLLLHEGRSVIYVARQLGHDARLTLTTYGHVMDELDDQPRQDAEAVILAARSGDGTMTQVISVLGSATTPVS